MSSHEELDTIEPVLEVPAKRHRTETNWSKCLFCQGKESLSNSTPVGIMKVFSSFQERCPFETTEMIMRLKLDLTTQENIEKKQPRWHKSCYASFTS